MERSTMTPPNGLEEIRTANLNELPALSANDMRRLAEKADGWRKFDPILARQPDGTVDVIMNKDLKNEVPLLRFNTLDRNKGLSRNVRIRIQVETAAQTTERVFDIPNVEEADAVFVTQSAVSKFLLPYYLRFKEPAAVEKIAAEVFDQESVIGVIHLPGSSYKADKVGVVSLDKAEGVTLKVLPV